MKKWNKFHIYLLQPLLNLMPLLWIDIFYDNYTFLANHHHFFFVLCWAISTLYGFYFYALKIWKQYSIPYHKKKHTFACFGMFLVVLIPYQNHYSILNDCHVWLFILSFCLYLSEWIHIAITNDQIIRKDCRFLLIAFLLCLSSFFFLGSMTAFCESMTSLVMNDCLYSLSKNKN